MTQLPTPGRALRVLREQSGLTAREVAERAGVSESYLSRVETGREDASPAWIGCVAAAISRALTEGAQPRKVAA
ncbi:helix-turn-helix domain-containing protein [Microbacterium gubbeenense]|uniref:helix-turn-helix domain-containing protein n=1 Tax=Microbacterium gubbeenense TaxID=159896 RepID=UPI0004003D8B|nr:helix-turn-helix transcriptional regulator [Microbacterium gubbeenense]